MNRANKESKKAGGNTRTPASKKDDVTKQGTQRKRWIFTYNNYEKGDIDVIIKKFRDFRANYIFGEEIGQSGTPHLQGYIELPNKMRWTEFGLMKGIHWNNEPVKGSRQDNINYCSKDGKIHTNFIIKKERRPVEDLLDETKLWAWQEELYELLKLKPDPRKILWFWDKNGGVGKSDFCKFLCSKLDATMLGGGTKDMMKGIHGYDEATGDYPNIVIGDYPRDNLDRINYGAWEQVKNGHVFCSKYESQQMIFNKPHVVIFANELPDMQAWSKDRYFIKEIKKEDCVIKEKKIILNMN